MTLLLVDRVGPAGSGSTKDYDRFHKMKKHSRKKLFFSSNIVKMQRNKCNFQLGLIGGCVFLLLS